MKKMMTAGLALAVLLTGAIAGEAATITAFEEIGDSTCTSTGTSASTALCADLERNLYRIRDDGAGNVATELDDADITASVAAGGNAVGADFGLFNFNDFGYTHDTNWLSNVTGASLLEIWAYDVDGGNDVIYRSSTIPENIIGSLDNGNGSITLSDFTANLTLSGGLLAITVDKTPNNPTANQDRINVFRSRLSFTYDDGTTEELVATPEPGSMILLGSGLAALAFRRYRSRRA